MPHRGNISEHDIEPYMDSFGCVVSEELSFSTPKGNESSPISRRDFLVGTGISLTALMMRVSWAGTDETNPVKVGFILPDQGPSAQEARSMVAGFDFFLKEKRAHSLEILKKDSGPNDEKTLEALAELLVNNKVHFLVGPPSLNGSEKTIHGLSGGTTILFITNPSVRLVAGEMCQPAIFRVRPNTYQSSQPLAPWALKNIGARAFITGEDDVQGNEEADYFAYVFERSGGTFADRIMFQSASGRAKSILDGIEKSRPDFVFASLRQKATSVFLKALRGVSSNSKLPVIGPESLTAFPGTLTTLGKTSLGVRTLSTMKDPQDFTSRLKQELGIDVAYAERAAEGYDMAHIIYQAAHAIPEDKNDPTKLAKFIEDITIEGPRGTIRFDRNHEPVVDMAVQEWHPSGRSFERRVLEQLGPSRSLDFGCGEVGFPKRPETETKEEEVIWDDQSD